MSRAGLCVEDVCTECRAICVRVYRELRGAGIHDEKAFDAATRVLELRHPGRLREFYRGLAAEWIAGDGDL